MLRIAEEAGFVIINLADVYRNEDLDAIRLAEWDEHPERTRPPVDRRRGSTMRCRRSGTSFFR